MVLLEFTGLVVMVDFPHVMAQLGVDLFQGHGWEKYDNREKTPLDQSS